jgi:hypothetical protein
MNQTNMKMIKLKKITNQKKHYGFTIAIHSPWESYATWKIATVISLYLHVFSNIKNYKREERL